MKLIHLSPCLRAAFYDRDSKRMRAPKVAPVRVSVQKLKEQSNNALAILKQKKRVSCSQLNARMFSRCSPSRVYSLIRPLSSDLD